MGTLASGAVVREDEGLLGHFLPLRLLRSDLLGRGQHNSAYSFRFDHGKSPVRYIHVSQKVHITVRQAAETEAHC